MQNRYQHSEVFAKMKAINEDIKVNLTSLEYLQVLDYFLKNAWEQIITFCPEFVDHYLVKVLAFNTLHRSVKVCSEPKKSLPILILKCIASTGKQKVHAFERLHLNRGIIFGCITQFLKLADQRAKIWSVFNNDLQLREKFILSDRIDALLGYPDKDKFQTVYGNVVYWNDKAKEFRSMICQKYTRLALLQAQKAYTQYNCRISLNDISIIYCMIVGKAVDRCDARFGVLTSFIQNWMKSAQCQVIKLLKEDKHLSLEALHEQYGDSFDLPTTSIETSIDSNVSDIAYKAKIADKDGVLRATLGIPEYLSIKDHALLEGLAV